MKATSRELFEAPATLPVSLQAIKDHLNVPMSETDNDEKILLILRAAVNRVEEICNRRLITQTWDAYFSGFPYSEPFELPFPKLQEVVYLKYYDSNGVLTTLSSSSYQVQARAYTGSVWPGVSVNSWPTVQSNRLDPVNIRFICGYGDNPYRNTVNPGDVPLDLIMAILTLAASWYDNPSAAVEGVSVSEVPHTVSSLIMPYRVF